MELQQRLMGEIKEAMKAKAAERLGALRLILNALKEREINARGTDGAAGDELAVLAKMVKQRQESVKVYLEGGRPELAAKETAEIAVIEEFLPKQLGAAEVEAVVTAAIAEVGATSVKDMGRVMGVLKAKYTGQMDFGAVGALIKAKF
ncbi:GatB/YqeY domain-containing protein [Stagnihabitans tardus]|uniref:GatB/YqeY domain-containing protein n=1 Tax=Stagnihabitans tardus TaxID=2699202 RepID=A0AAE5BTY4_9RHOB|nr:GatB/YqeY domain-containing protein [Stagnihabitans tardus]NBZ86209.1 GatB/YqeY domain-containing protein [Stagnihabitans tardus]